MTNFEKLTEHTSVDITTQMTTRSCTLGAISLGEYAIAIDTGNPLEQGIKVRKDLEKHLKLPIHFLFISAKNPNNATWIPVMINSIVNITLGIPPTPPVVITVYNIYNPNKTPTIIKNNPILPKNFKGSKSR